MASSTLKLLLKEWEQKKIIILSRSSKKNRGVGAKNNEI